MTEQDVQKFSGVFRNINLSHQQLQDAQFDAIISGCNFAHANLSGAVFTSPLSGCDFTFANFQGAHISTMNRCDFRYADLQNATICNVHSNSTFEYAHLSGATLRDTFSRINFRGAEFLGADLSGAHLVHCDFTDADHLKELQLRQANMLRGTILPNGELYDGRWNLAGDIHNAEQAGYDLSKTEDRALFYKRERLLVRTLVRTDEEACKPVAAAA